MKKLYFLLIVLFCFNSVNAQVISIPDKVFKEILLRADTGIYIAYDINGKTIKIDSNNNKEIEVSEAKNVSKLIISSFPSEGIVKDFTGIEYFSNLKQFSCSGNYSPSLDFSAIKSLEFLSCSSAAQMKTLNISGLEKLQKLEVDNCTSLTALDLSGVPNLEYLNCSQISLNTIDLSSLKKLIELEATSNVFNSLDFTGLVHLKKINISGGKLTNLVLTGLNNLESLNCSLNMLTNLNLTGLNSMEDFKCSSNKLNNIDLSELTKLKTLYADSNFLTNLNVLNCKELEYLKCDLNQLTSLEVSNLPQLKTINCSDNELTDLNLTGCMKLTNLECNRNKFVKLNPGNLRTLENLICRGNVLLTDLNTKGLENLLLLICPNTSLVTLDLTNNLNLIDLDVSLTKIELLDLSPLKKLQAISFFNNSSLRYVLLKNGKTYTPHMFGIPNLKYLCVDEENIQFYQEILTRNNIKNCEINAYCNFASGKERYIVNGENKYDFNGKGCISNNSLFSNVKYTVTNGSNISNFYSTKEGSYAIATQEGTITIKPSIENPNYFIISPSFVNVTFPAQSSPFTQDFCISVNGIHPDLEIVLIPLEAARPGFDAKYKIVYKNKGNQVQSGSVGLVFNDDVLDLILSKPAGSAQGNNKLSWNFNELKPFETREITFTVNVNSPMETPAVNNGDILKFTATIISSEKDDTPLDNTFTLSQTVVGSYDPNDKTCLEGTVITPNLIGEYVHYIIRFENTGTYPAQNIVVKDIIDFNKFDISTLIPTSSSHSFVTKISEGNKVEFIFENINLPFDDTNNDGYVAFKIKTKPTLKVGDSFTNEANIYFDYNFPILTNKATSTFKTALGITDFDFSKYFMLYPNPSNQILNISKTDNIEIQSFEIYDILGQLIIAVPNAKTTSTIDVSKLQMGNYFIKVKSDKGSSSMKFIKI